MSIQGRPITDEERLIICSHFISNNFTADIAKIEDLTKLSESAIRNVVAQYMAGTIDAKGRLGTPKTTVTDGIGIVLQPSPILFVDENFPYKEK